jgi:zona occludens toxin (predicted ATPase)
MIVAVTGLMGSGKTAGAIKFALDDQAKYSKVFTNIQGFEYRSAILDNRWYPIDYNAFFEFLESEYRDFLTHNDDAVLVRNFSSYFEIPKDSIALLIIDECHNFFDRSKDFLVWFITYHRHLNLDVYMITQNVELLHRSYQKVIQEYRHFLPASRTLLPRFKYTVHIAYPYRSDTTLVSTHSLKKDPTVFELYSSGDAVRQSNVLYRYFAYIALGILATFGFFAYMTSSGNSDTSSFSASVDKPVVPAQSYREPIYKDDSKAFKSDTQLYRYLVKDGSDFDCGSHTIPLVIVSEENLLYTEPIYEGLEYYYYTKEFDMCIEDTAETYIPAPLVNSDDDQPTQIDQPKSLLGF